MNKKLEKIKKQGFLSQCILWSAFFIYLTIHFVILYTTLSEAWDIMAFVIDLIILAWILGYWKGLDDNE